jgi:hypothetical protein
VQSQPFRQVLACGRPSAWAWLGWIMVALILGGYGARFALFLLDHAVSVPSHRLQWGVGLSGFANLMRRTTTARSLISTASPRTRR